MHKRTLEKLPFFARVAIGAGIGIVSALASTLLFSLIASLSKNPTANLTLYGEISLIFAMLLCGFFGARLGGEQKLACGLVSAGILLVIEVFLALVFASNLVKALILAAIAIFVAASGAAMGSREKKRKRR